ncbi:MAG: hypothetical protein GY757_00720 [bacterium]|nr:hypothetical protein [bacterium]
MKPFSFPAIISILESAELVSRVEIVKVDEIILRGFYKIRCNLKPLNYNFAIKFIKTRDEFIYAYQLYTTESLLRWDNEPHFPALSTFPHHFHDSDGNVLESPLTGNAETDLEIVLSKIEEFLEDINTDPTT